MTAQVVKAINLASIHKVHFQVHNLNIIYSLIELSQLWVLHHKQSSNRVGIDNDDDYNDDDPPITSNMLP